MEQLPNKLSALLRIAVEDAQKIEKTPGYRLDMGTWHTPSGTAPVCRVCMAGAVMVARLDVPDEVGSEAAFAMLDWGIEKALDAIDDMRSGWMSSAARSLGLSLTSDQSAGLKRMQDRLLEGGSGRPGDDTLLIDRLPWPRYLEIAAELEGMGL